MRANAPKRGREASSAIVARLTEALRARGRKLRGAKILILGLAYKRDVDDPRESPAFQILSILRARGARASYHDPHIPKFPSMRHWRKLRVPSVKPTARTLAAQDAVVIVTDHTAIDYGRVVKHAKLVVDTRNATRNVRTGRDKIVRA